MKYDVTNQADVVLDVDLTLDELRTKYRMDTDYVCKMTETGKKRFKHNGYGLVVKKDEKTKTGNDTAYLLAKWDMVCAPFRRLQRCR